MLNKIREIIITVLWKLRGKTVEHWRSRWRAPPP